MFLAYGLAVRFIYNSHVLASSRLLIWFCSVLFLVCVAVADDEPILDCVIAERGKKTQICLRLCREGDTLHKLQRPEAVQNAICTQQLVDCYLIE